MWNSRHVSSPAAAAALLFMHCATQHIKKVPSRKSIDGREDEEVRRTIVVHLIVIVDQRAACIPVTGSDIPQSSNTTVQLHLLISYTSHLRSETSEQSTVAQQTAIRAL